MNLSDHVHMDSLPIAYKSSDFNKSSDLSQIEIVESETTAFVNQNDVNLATMKLLLVRAHPEVHVLLFLVITRILFYR